MSIAVSRLRAPSLALRALLLLVGIPFLRPAPALAWEGHDWEEWRAATGATRPSLTTPQAGRADLVPLLDADPPAAPSRIDSIRGWEAKRDRILGTLRALTGEPTAEELLPASAAPEAVLGERFEAPDHVRVHVRIRAEAEDWIPAWLLLPRAPAGADGRPGATPSVPTPTLLVFHQTVAQGKDEPCGVQSAGSPANDPDMALALELVRRGFVCLAPDAVGFGERIPPGAAPYATARDFHARHPRWSFFGKMAWDASRCVDWLLTRPEVDPWRIGMVGHSHGAYGAIVCAAFEPRVSAVVANCGFTFLRDDPTPERWSHATALLPSLGFFVGDVASAPIDWHEIVACLAPRRFLYRGTLGDAGFPNLGRLEGVFEQLEEIYGLHGRAGDLRLRLEGGPHGFPAEARVAAWDWLEQELPPRPIPPARFESARQWEEFRPRLRALIERDLGPLPDVAPPVANIYERLPETVEESGYRRVRLRFGAYDGETIPAFALLPPGAGEPGAEPASFPGVVVFHQTTEAGKDEPAGLSGRDSMRFGPEFARAGWIVLIPDSITAGERITGSGAFDTRDHYRRHPEISALGKMILDGRRAVDVLRAIPGVDPHRVAAAGHSLGAEIALFVAAFDERVGAAVASCGFAPLAVEKQPDRWARDGWFSYMPGLRPDLRAGRRPAWDFDDVISLVAPRGYFNHQGTRDEIFPEASASPALVESTRPIWALHGETANERLRSRAEDGPHDFGDEARREALEWLARTLAR